MNYVLVGAIFYIIWWVVLFAVLPFSLRTQEEDGEVTLGTVKSAPRGPHVLRAMLRTTIITLLLFGVWYLVVEYYGFGFDDIPIVIPQFG
ncbi:MAG: DUF1467 family protein [Rhizobiaceae bacterium]